MGTPHKLSWTDALRAECYAAYIGGTLAEWCAPRGLDVHATRSTAQRWAGTHGLPLRRETCPLDDADLTRPVAELVAQYGVTRSAVSHARKRAQLSPPKPPKPPPPPSRPVRPVVAHAARERAEIAAGAPETIRIGPRGFALDTSSPAAAYLDRTKYTTKAEPDAKWLAEFEARMDRRLGTYGETL